MAGDNTTQRWRSPIKIVSRGVRQLLRVLTVVSISGAIVLPSAQATNSRPELESVMAMLMKWLPGEFSSKPQLELERQYGAPPDGEHYDWYRVFAQINAPHIGEHVIYGQLHIGDKSQPIVPGTQVLYIVSIDEAHMAVSVSGRRIANPEQFAFAHEHPELWATMAIDPDYGGNCDFRWRLHGNQIVGRLAQKGEAAIDGNCSMTSKKSGVNMTWDAEWVLNDKELWIYDNGYLDDGVLFQGREDRTHIRLTRVE